MEAIEISTVDTPYRQWLFPLPGRSCQIHHGDLWLRALFSFGTCSGHMFWDIFLAFFCGSGKGLMVWDVTRAHVVARVRDSCCETCAGTML